MIIDKWWSKKEKIKLGILEEEAEVVTMEEFKERLDDLSINLQEYKKILRNF